MRPNPRPDRPPAFRGPGGLVVDLGSRRVTANATTLELSALEFDVLATLMARQGEVVHYSDLMQGAWGFFDQSGVGSIRTAIYRLRGALATIGVPDNLISAVRGVGYRIDWDERAKRHPLLDPSALEAALRLIGVPALLVGLDGQLVLANLAMARLVGLDVQKLEGMPMWLAVLDPDSWSSAGAAFSTALSGHEVSSILVQPASSDERQTPVSLTATPIEDKQSVIGVLVTLLPSD